MSGPRGERMLPKKIISIIPMRETCDTCDKSLPSEEYDSGYYCPISGEEVSSKGWCKEYNSLVKGLIKRGASE